MHFITKKEAPLLEQVQEAFPESSKTTCRSWIKEGRILVDQKQEKRTDTVIKDGTVITLQKKAALRKSLLEIVYEDKDLVVVNKPTSLLSVKKESGDEHSVHSLLKERYPGKKIYVIHRLDQDTSGLILFALSERAFHILKEALQERQISRKYHALVEGKIEKAGFWENFLEEDKSLKMRVVKTGGVRAKTLYRPLKVYPTRTLIECELETGKKNQIRVQAAYAHHPVVGDKKYGKGDDHAKRLFLHASSLSFLHPITKKPMIFQLSPPDIFLSASSG
jgi:23S rRNA pseudouridine1911/1915/1917 synthase